MTARTHNRSLQQSMPGEAALATDPEPPSQVLQAMPGNLAEACRGRANSRMATAIHLETFQPPSRSQLEGSLRPLSLASLPTQPSTPSSRPLSLICPLRRLRLPLRQLEDLAPSNIALGIFVCQVVAGVLCSPSWWRRYFAQYVTLVSLCWILIKLVSKMSIPVAVLPRLFRDVASRMFLCHHPHI